MVACALSPLGLSPNQARLAAMLVCASLVFPFCSSKCQVVVAAITLIGVAAGAHQGWSANLFNNFVDMFPRSAVGAVVRYRRHGGIYGQCTICVLRRPHPALTPQLRDPLGIASSTYLLALVALYLLAPGSRRWNSPT